jgi:ParB family chromosome partitioning protein
LEDIMKNVSLPHSPGEPAYAGSPRTAEAIIQGNDIGEIVYLDADELRPNPLNPRGIILDEDVEELTESIKTEGRILQPLVALPDGTIVIGHRRYRAGNLAGLLKFPCIIREMTVTEQLRVMMVENIQRKDLNPLQEARGYQAYMDETNGNVMDTSRAMGVPHTTISHRLLILTFPREMQMMFARLDLPVSAAMPLSRLASEDDQVRVAQMIVARTLSVPKLEKFIKQNGLDKNQPRRTHERKNKSSQRPAGPVRDKLVETLEARKEETITIGDLLREFDFVSCACGMSRDPHGQETMCAACPLAHFMNRFAKVLETNRELDTLRVAKDIKGVARDAQR